MKVIATIITLAGFIALAALPSCKKNISETPDIIQVSPANNATDVAPTQAFACTAVPGAVSYVFYFSQGTLSFSDTSSTNSVTVQGLTSCISYTWLVIARKADGSIAATTNWHFTVGGGATPCPEQPENNSTGVCLNPTLSWSATPGASSYNVEVSASPTFSTLAYTTTVSTTYCTVPAHTLGLNTSYYWRVGHGTYSTPFIFATIGAPALTFPAANTSGVSRSPDFTWASNACTNNYIIDISTNSNFSSIVKTAQVTGPSYSLPSQLTLSAYTTYYWRVQLVDYGAYSGVGAFTTGL